MTRFHAVMLDETRCEFGHTFDAESRSAAYDYLKENFPESQCVQLESSEDTRRREQAMEQHILAGGDWDDEGRPIFHHEFGDDDYDEEDWDEGELDAAASMEFDD